MNEQEFNSLPIAQRKAAQQRLIDAGLYSGSPDGFWGPGTASAFKAEEKRRVDDADRERKANEERDFRNRQLKIDEAKGEAEAAEKKATAQKKLQETKDAAAKAERKAKYDEDAASGLGMAAKFGANIASPAVTGIAGFKTGKGINAGLNAAQEYMNRKLKGVAQDRVAGLTTRDAAQKAVKLSGAMPIENRAGRVTSRMLPHLGLGAFGLGKGAEILYNTDQDQPYYAYQADRGAGLGYIGAGAGMMKAGMGHASNPAVTPDSQALAVINSPQLRRSGTGATTIENAEALPRGPLKTIDAEVIPDEPQKALPAPKQQGEGRRQNSERLISAAKSGGATGIKNKGTAATWIEANITDENRAAIAKELGVKPGPKFQQRVLTAVKNMAKSRGASAIAPLVAGLTAFAATPKRAEASSGDEVTGMDEALTNAGITGGLAYGTGKALQAVPKAIGRAASAGLTMATPFMAADAYDPTPEELNRDRNIGARYLPSFLRAGGIEEAYQIAQVPEANPERQSLGPRIADSFAGQFEPPANPDAAIDEALGIVRRANGGRVSGGFHYDTGGRTDNIPLDVVPGTYIIPADVVSALGQGNTMAGIKVLDNMFPPQMEAPKPAAGAKRAEGGRVPIIVAGGEFKVDPYHVAALGEGDVQSGADMLDEWVQSVRQQHIDTLSKLPGPAESAAEEGRQRAPFEQGGHARSVSEDEVQFGYNPIDELRQSINTSVFTPEQAAENRRRTLMEALSVIPGPGNVISAHDAYSSAGDASDAYQAGDYRGAAISGGLSGLAALGAALGLPVGKLAKGAADAGKDTLNIFAGPVAKTADHAALSKAQEMASAGASRDDIWRDTGWFQGTDGKWRFEIDDSAASLAGEKYIGGGITMSSGLEHPAYTSAYGNQPQTWGYIERGKSPGGAYFPEQKLLHKDGIDPARIEIIAGNADDAKSINLHELQHVAQDFEGFARGGTWRQMRELPEAKAAVQDRFQQMKASGANMADEDILANAEVSVARDMYHRLAGEVEARNVQARIPMSATERRAKSPWLTQDVPDDQQIVRFR